MTPREVVLAYNLELWNGQRYELADEIIAEQVVRHEIGSVSTLSRKESLQRVIDAWDRMQHMHFTLLQVVAEADLVTIVYQCDYTRKDGRKGHVSSIEVFRVADGQICEVWNAAHTPDAWC